MKDIYQQLVKNRNKSIGMFEKMESNKMNNNNNNNNNNTNNTNNANNTNNEFSRFPFARNDKIVIKILISSNLCLNGEENRNSENIQNMCDPSLSNSNPAIKYLLTNNGAEIKATTDFYEITLG